MRIARDLAGHHHIWLSGPDTGQEPTRGGSIPTACSHRYITPIGSHAADGEDLHGTKSFAITFLIPPRGIPLFGRVRRKEGSGLGGPSGARSRNEAIRVA